MSGIGSVRDGQPVGSVEGVSSTDRPGTAGELGVSTAPPPVDGGIGPSGAPVLEPPRIAARDLADRVTVLGARLGLASGDTAVSDPDFSAMLIQIEEEQSKLGDRQVSTQAHGVELAKQKAEKNLKDQLVKLDEMIAKEKEQDTWGLFGKIFGYIAAVAAIFATAGAASGLAGAALVMMIAQDTHALEAMGVDKDLGDKIMLGVTIAITVVSLGSAAYGLYQAGKEAAKLAVNVTLKFGARLTAGVAGVATGASQVGASVTGYQLAGMEQDRARLASANLKIKDEQEQLAKKLRELLEQAEDSVRIVVQTLGSQHEAIGEEMRNMLKS